MRIITSIISSFSALGLLAAGVLRAQGQPSGAAGPDAVVNMPQMAVVSQRVALQEPSAGAFAMPVSALCFEPLVDVQARNMGEAQADVTIRGGIFENTGFRAGAVPLFDPQTGHYSAEIPIDPAMLTAPEILTGAGNALGGWNANAGTVAYQWRRITARGAANIAGGAHATARASVYQGWVAPENTRVAGRRLALDASLSRAVSHGSRPWGESRFSRCNARLQLAGASGQTDLFFGRQDKFIGWPNLYTPYDNVFETDRLRTTLVALNHVEKLGSGGDHLTIGAAWRRNDDHYVFNRADAGAANPAYSTIPSLHTTRVWCAGAEALVSKNQIRWRASAGFVADSLKSTSLVHGRFNSRSHIKLALAPERAWALPGARTLAIRAGAACDATNRDGAAWSPVVSAELRAPGRLVELLHASWAVSSQAPNYTALNSSASAGLFRGNPDLGRERAGNIEIGARAARGAWTLGATAFCRRDSGLVDWVYSTKLPNARVASAVDVDTLGLELTARLAAKWGTLVMGCTALSKNPDYGAAADTVDASFYALNHARLRLTAAVVARPWRGWEIRLDNEARLQEPNTLRRSGDKSLLTAAGVFCAPFAQAARERPPTAPPPSARASSAWRALRFFAQITNAWDTSFEDVPSVPAPRRQWCAGVTSSW